MENDNWVTGLLYETKYMTNLLKKLSNQWFKFNKEKGHISESKKEEFQKIFNEFIDESEEIILQIEDL